MVWVEVCVTISSDHHARSDGHGDEGEGDEEGEDEGWILTYGRRGAAAEELEDHVRQGTDQTHSSAHLATRSGVTG